MRIIPILLIAVWSVFAFETSIQAQDTFQETEDKRKAVKERVQLPYLIEAKNFKLFFDRRDPTFRLADDTSGVSWSCALDRRGFASVILASEKGSKEFPIDQMEITKVRGDLIEFMGKSSAGDFPEIVFTVKTTSPLIGLEFSYKFTNPVPTGTQVKLFDRSFWASDVDDGACLWPANWGEWHLAKTPTPLKVRVQDPYKTSVEGISIDEEDKTAWLEGLIVRKQEIGLVVAWSGTQVTALLERIEEKSKLYTGERRLQLSMTLEGQEGSLKLYPLGRTRFQELLSSFKQLVEHPEKYPSLRYKTGRKKEHRILLDSAAFDFSCGAQGKKLSFKEIDQRSKMLRDTLGIHRALFRLSDWSQQEGAEIKAKSDLGGVSGLTQLQENLRSREHLLGLSISLEKDESIRQFTEKSVGLLEDLQPGLIHLKGFNSQQIKSNSDIQKHLQRWKDCTSYLSELGIMVSGDLFHLSQLQSAVSLDVQLGPQAPSQSPFPFLNSVHGQHGRFFELETGGLKISQTDRFLDYLIRGEVPVYAWTPDSKEESLFSREDGGWYEGQNLSSFQRFVKTTYEITSKLAELRYRNPVHSYKKLDGAGNVEEIYYGYDLRVVVNRGDKDFTDPDRGFVLPKGGFWIQHPFYLAFHAKKAFGVSYKTPVLFTIRSLEGKLWLRAEKVRIWHGFGPSNVKLGGKDFNVKRELITRIW